MKDHPKLLLIAGYFPPVRISTGSIRPWNLARCLIELGWEVTVVTPKISVWNAKNLDNVEGIKEEIKQAGIKMIYSDHPLKCLAPWRYKVSESKLYWFFGGILRRLTRYLGIQNWIGWVPGALHACRNLKAEDLDVILATGAPFWGFEIAYQISKRLKKPFIMDYRDLWTNNPWNPANQKWITCQEKRLLNHCAVVTVVSPISGEALAKKYSVSKKIKTITNGYNSDEVLKISESKFDHFSIIFAGMLLPPKLTFHSLFAALNLLKQDRSVQKNWKFHYFGPSVEEVKNEIEISGLVEDSVIHGNIPRNELLSISKGASLNAVISSNSKNPTLEDKGVIPGKVYELIGMGASLLPIVPKGSAVEQVLTDVGVKCFSHEDPQEIANFIVACMQGQKPGIINPEKYSWNELSKEFDALLKSIA